MNKLTPRMRRRFSSLSSPGSFWLLVSGMVANNYYNYNNYIINYLATRSRSDPGLEIELTQLQDNAIQTTREKENITITLPFKQYL